VSQILIYDEAASRRIEALNRTPEMGAQRDHVLRELAPRAGERILDIGCGPGHLAFEIAARVGPRGAAYGVDVSEHMLAIARVRRARVATGVRIELQSADATALPFEAATFDAAVATQTYEFVEDIGRSVAELYRVLRPGGRALILDTDWHSVVWHSSDDARMRVMLDAWQGRVAHPHLPRGLSCELRHAGFDITCRETFTIFDPEGREDSYSTHQIHHIAAALASSGEVSELDVRAWAADLRALARGGCYFFSLNRYVFRAVKPAAP
jgi:arsenite methyltransferase